MLINIKDENIDTLTGWMGMLLAQNTLAPDAREAFENLYAELTNESEERSYFAEDGNYGSADKLAVVDTSKWTGEEWAIVEENSDYDRPAVATQLAEMIESGEIVR